MAEGEILTTMKEKAARIGIQFHKDVLFQILRDPSREELVCFESFDVASETNPVLLTNFQRSQREIYERAIVDSGMNHVFVADMAVDELGRVMPDYLRLMATEVKDLGEFWKKLEALKNG